MRFPIKITDNFLLEPVMHMFGARPEVSYCEVEGGKLQVRMGGWFDETFALDSIAGLAPSTWPWWGGLGVKLYHHGVAVVGAAEGIVNIKLKEPTKVSVAVLDVKCEQLWVSLIDPQGFLDMLSRLTGVAVSEHVAF